MNETAFRERQIRSCIYCRISVVIANQSPIITLPTQKGKGKKNKECENMSWSSGERQEGVQVLRQLLDLNLALLFDPPVVHETFVEQVGSL